MHCLAICHRCDRNCVLCENKVATVKRHHPDFCHKVHDRVSVRSLGCFRNGRVVGLSLLLAGALTSAALPRIGWDLFPVLIAGMLRGRA